MTAIIFGAVGMLCILAIDVQNALLTQTQLRQHTARARLVTAKLITGIARHLCRPPSRWAGA